MDLSRSSRWDRTTVLTIRASVRWDIYVVGALLTFTDLISLGVSGAVIAGVRPESSPNVGAYDARADLLDGASPKITTQYPGSVTETFDLEKFYFGCVVATAEAVISAPISCSVRVQGYKASIAVADQTFEFNAPLLTLVEDMDEATLNDQFKDVDTVTFTTEYNGVPVVGNLVGATLIDSLSYKTYNTEDKDGNNNNGGNNNNNGGNNNNNVGNNSGDNNSGDKQEPWSSV